MPGFEFRFFIQRPSDALLTALVNRYGSSKFKDRADLYLPTFTDGDVGVKLRDARSDFSLELSPFFKLDKEKIDVKICLATASIDGFEAEQLSKTQEKLHFSRPPEAVGRLCSSAADHGVYAKRWESAIATRTALLAVKQRSLAVVDEVDTEFTFVNAKILREGVAPRWSAGWVSVSLEHADLAVLVPAVRSCLRLLATPGCAPSNPHDIIVGSYARWVDLVCAPEIEAAGAAAVAAAAAPVAGAGAGAGAAVAAAGGASLAGAVAAASPSPFSSPAVTLAAAACPSGPMPGLTPVKVTSPGPLLGAGSALPAFSLSTPAAASDPHDADRGGDTSAGPAFPGRHASLDK